MRTTIYRMKTNLFKNHAQIENKLKIHILVLFLGIFLFVFSLFCLETILKEF